MDITARDLLPLVRKLSREERERLAQLAVGEDDTAGGEALSPAAEPLAASGGAPDYEHMTFNELLSSMPEVGEDSDFERRRDHGREIDL
jgi:hypothetical protein